IIVGGVGVLAAVLFPIVRTTRTTSVREREVPAAIDDHDHEYDDERHYVGRDEDEDHEHEGERVLQPGPSARASDDPRAVRDESADAEGTRHRGLFHRRSRTDDRTVTT